MSEQCNKLHQLFNEMKQFSFPFNEQDIPDNGIYILFEKGEKAHKTNRIVRIGTHDGDGRLKIRLKDHFMKKKQRNSIFRKHIGRCMLNKANDSYITSWNLGFKSVKDKEKNKQFVNLEYEEKYENKISEYIQNNLSFVIIPNINSKSERKYFESKLISTISFCKECYPSKDWLGLNHPNEKIRLSGLWNINELYKEQITDEEIKILREKIKNGKILLRQKRIS